jgi:uncharacterized protein (TIGR02646 family)
VRTINKRNEPRSYVQWRAPRVAANAAPGMVCSYEELRRHPEIITAVEHGLLAEQGWICAYTGCRIAPGTFHVEHLKPQMHCAFGEDADYKNLVACWPEPHCRFEPEYGARRKGSWPAPHETDLFVSPLSPTCGPRFVFNRHGEIQAAQAQDVAAHETIERLGLDHKTLTAFRRQAIHGALRPRSKPIRLTDARKLLRRLDADEGELDKGGTIRLAPFCFAVRQAVAKEIKKLEAIVKHR